MDFGPKPAPVDPELEREKAASRADKISSIRDDVSSFTDQLIRQFGAKLALGKTTGPGATGKLPPILGGF